MIVHINLTVQEAKLCNKQGIRFFRPLKMVTYSHLYYIRSLPYVTTSAHQDVMKAVKGECANDQAQGIPTGN